MSMPNPSGNAPGNDIDGVSRCSDERRIPYYPVSECRDFTATGPPLSSGPLLALGILSMVAGTVAIAVGITGEIARLGLFVLAGGGSPQAFDQQTSDRQAMDDLFQSLGVMTFGLGVAALVVRSVGNRR